MKTVLPESINSLEEAKEFLKALYDNGESYHPEDKAATIVGDLPDGRLFTDKEASELDAIMTQVHDKFSFDPCEYILSLDK